MRLKTLTYTSRARLDLTAADLAEIHETARHLNALDGVTGLLVFDGVRFLQIVEGAEDAIDNLLARLREDDRHSSIEVRDERFVADRGFPEWAMELVAVSGAGGAAREVDARLPEAVPPAIRSLVLRMSEALAAPL